MSVPATNQTEPALFSVEWFKQLSIPEQQRYYVGFSLGEYGFCQDLAATLRIKPDLEAWRKILGDNIPRDIQVQLYADHDNITFSNFFGDE